MSKPTLVVFPDLLKAHVDQYTRSDGTVVQAHDDKRQAAAPKPAGPVHAAEASKMVSSHLHKMGWGAGKMYHAEHGDHGVASANGKVAVFKKKGMEHVSSFDHDPYNFTDSHAKALAEKIHGSVGGSATAAAPKPGEVGHHEHTQYGAYFRPGDKVKDQTGKTHEVAEHNGASVRTKGGEMFHPTKLKHAGESKPAAPAKTGSAAPARTVNAGTDKYPMRVKSSEKLAAKHDDGSTHHVGGFKPPGTRDGTGGDHAIHHDGKPFSFTGKSGKNTKTGEASYEYAHHGDNMEHRAWVTHSGHLMND